MCSGAKWGQAEYVHTDPHLSLQEFVKDAGSYSRRMVDDLLDQITGGDHSRVLFQLRQVRPGGAARVSGPGGGWLVGRRVALPHGWLTVTAARLWASPSCRFWGAPGSSLVSS